MSLADLLTAILMTSLSFISLTLAIGCVALNCHDVEFSDFLVDICCPMSILMLSCDNERSMMSNSRKNVVIRLRPGTRSMLDRIAAARRWSLAEAADMAITEFVDRHKISRVGRADVDQPEPAMEAVG